MYRTNVIKVQFIRDEKPSGREYTYYANDFVEVGDFVKLESRTGVSKGVVTAVNVPLSEIEKFKDKAKTVLGIWEDEPVNNNSNTVESE